MPSSIADPLYERLLRAYPADRAYARDDWTDAPMPSPVRHFLEQLLRHQCHHEMQRLRNARTEWVEYDHPEMKRSAHAFEETMESYAQVPRSEWPGTLRQATHHVTSFLVRPTHVLTEFVFGDTTALDLDQVRWRMSFFGPYTYLREAVHAYTEQRDLASLRREQFRHLLSRIDAHLTDDYDAERWLKLLDPLFKIARVATDSDKVPTRLLRTFFAEKQSDEIVRRLETYTANGPDHIGPKTLFRLIQDGVETSPPPPSTSSSPPSSPPPLASDSTSSSTPSPRSDAPPLRSSRPAASESDAPAPSPSHASAPPNTPSSPVSEGSDPPDAAPPPTSPPPAADAASSDAASSDAASSDAASSTDADRDDADVPTDHDDIWGVAGPARPAGSPTHDPSDETSTDGSTPLWKQFQQGTGDGSSASQQAPASASEQQTPLWARFQSSRRDAGPPPPSTASSDASDSTSSSSPDDPDASTAPSSSTPSAPSDAYQPGSDLTTMEHEVLGTSNPPQRAVYVRQLFGGSMDDYRHVLRQLRSADSWGEASQIIARDVFRAHKVNIYSDAAVHFTNAVEDRFRREA